MLDNIVNYWRKDTPVVNEVSENPRNAFGKLILNTVHDLQSQLLVKSINHVVFNL